MNQKDRPGFLLLMTRMKVSIPSQQKLTPKEEAVRIDVFWEELKNYSFETIETAFKKVFKNLKWFPAPVEIIEYIDSANQENEYQKYLEWSTKENRKLFKMIEFKNPSIDEIKKLVKKICDAIGEKSNPMPKLDGRRAEEFEEKRKIAKEKLKLLK